MKRSLCLFAFVALPLLGLGACVMPGDIDALRQNLDAFEAGAVTKPEFDARNQEIADEIEARNAELKEKAHELPTDPLQLLAWGGSMLATVVGTNKLRDHRRKMRGEATGTGHGPA